MQLIIPMSGSSQRFKDAGYTLPKSLIEVDGLPMVHHVINLFPGILDVVFICNKDDIQNTDMKSILLKVCPSAKIIEIDSHKKGPVYAVLQAIDSIADTEEIIVSYCDYSTVWSFEKFLSAVRGGNFDGAIAAYKGFHPHMLGSDNYAFCREDNNVLLEIKEKEPFTNDRMSEFASNGTYYFKTGSILKKYFQELIDLDININGEYYVSLVYNLLVRDGLKSLVFEIDKMLQFGTPDDLMVYQSWSNYFRSSGASNIDIPKQNFTLVLPMSGRGQRFKDCGYFRSKPFILVDGTPMFVNAVDCLPPHNNSVFICLKEHEDAEKTVKRYYPNAEVCIIDQVTQGQASTCKIGIKHAQISSDAPILISACDNGALYDKQKFADLIKDTENDVIVWSFRNNQTSKINPSMYSWLEVDDNNFIKSVSCKKFIGGNPLKQHAIIGTMYFRKAKYFLDGLEKNIELNRRVNGEFYVDDVLNQNIAAGLKVKVFEVDHYVCWGTPNDLNTYNYWKDHFNKICTQS